MVLIGYYRRPGGRWHVCTWAGPMQWRALCRAIEVENVYSDDAPPWDRGRDGTRLEGSWDGDGARLCGNCRRNARKVAARMTAIAFTFEGPVPR